MSLGQAIERAMKQSRLRTQVHLADALGVDQRTVSRIINGQVQVTVERVAEIERLCELTPGEILRWAGYVVDDVERPLVIDVVERDDRVSSRTRRRAAGRRVG